MVAVATVEAVRVEAVMEVGWVVAVMAVEETEGGWVEVATAVAAMAAVSAVATAVAAKVRCTFAQTRRALQRM